MDFNLKFSPTEIGKRPLSGRYELRCKTRIAATIFRHNSNQSRLDAGLPHSTAGADRAKLMFNVLEQPLCGA